MARAAVGEVPRSERLQQATRVWQALTEAVCPQWEAWVSWDEAIADRYEEWSAEMTVDIAFYLELARRTTGPLVELAVGNGRVAIPVAQATGQQVIRPCRAEQARWSDVLIEKKCADKGAGPWGGMAIPADT